MEKRIELEKRARKASQIVELNLDNCRSTSIVGLTDEYTMLETLSLINVGLITLKGFPKLPNLKKLELSDNRISNGLNYLATSPKLQYLNLSGNKIKDLEALKPLEEFKNLGVLDLFNNEATQIENYREKIFKMIPSLKYLDGLDSNEVEAPSEGEDDYEVNGNESYDEDQQMSFSINGLEIDLDELAVLERRVEAKRQQHNTDVASAGAAATSATAKPVDSTEIDELDEYLKVLQLKEKEQAKVATAPPIPIAPPTQPLSFALVVYWFLAILNLANAAYFSDSMTEEEDGSDDNDDDLEEEGEFDEGDVSLSEVYNDDLEEDNSDWDEEEAGGADDDDDYDDFDDEEEGAATAAAAGNGETAGTGKDKATSTKGGKSSKADADAAAAAAAASSDTKQVESADGDESQARGKKRKHDG